MITCQFNDAYFPILDGVVMAAHNYAYWLEKYNSNSYLIAPKVKDHPFEVSYNALLYKSMILPGMNPYRIGLPHFDLLFKRKMNNVNFDILHAHCPFITGQLALNLSKNLNVPLVASFHSKYKEDFKKTLDSPLFVDFMLKHVVNFYNSADYVWVPNKATGETLKEYGYRGEYTVVPNGTDMEVPDKPAYLKYRKHGLEFLGCKENDFILLFVGQHRWEKNVRMIIESLKTLKAENVKFKMVFVGEGYAYTDMQLLVRQMELNDHVIFTGLISDRNKLKHIYASADLFVFPSVYDNAPLVMMEAAAYQVPSIVVKDASASECIVDQVNGFTIDNSQESLAATIKNLSCHPEKIKRAGANAAKSIYRNWEGIVEEVNAKYADIINEHGHMKSTRYFAM
jgi:1,2-diacylglycerol 3-alpha-glucosyltransferase